MNIFRTTLSLLLTAGTIALTTGCKTKATYTLQAGKAQLEAANYAPELIEAVVGLQPIEQADFERLIKSESPDIRYLLAANQYLSTEQLELLVNDEDETIRAKAGSHLVLNWAQASKLYKEGSRVINQSLAANSSVAEDILLAIYEEKNPGLIYFAYNPNCPRLIQQHIRDSQDYKAKHWLESMKGVAAPTITPIKKDTQNEA